MEYIVDGKNYILSYQELRESYYEYIGLSDYEFLDRIIEVLHFVCIVSYLKEIPGYLLVNDRGLVHLIAHILDLKDNAPKEEFDLMRERFNSLMKLD